MKDVALCEDMNVGKCLQLEVEQVRLRKLWLNLALKRVYSEQIVNSSVYNFYHFALTLEIHLWLFYISSQK
jgi:hypothetical protein